MNSLSFYLIRINCTYWRVDVYIMYGVVLHGFAARIDGRLDDRIQDARVAARGSDEADAGAIRVRAFNKRISAVLHEFVGQRHVGRRGHRSILAHDLERGDA